MKFEFSEENMFCAPSSEPKADKNTANGYFCCHQAAQAAVKVYIANVDGKNAVLEINMPEENN